MNEIQEVQEEHKDCRVFGRAVGNEPPYQGAGRVEIPLSWGMIVEQIPPDGSFDTPQEAVDWGLTRARIWINDHAAE